MKIPQLPWYGWVAVAGATYVGAVTYAYAKPNSAFGKWLNGLSLPKIPGVSD